MRPLGDVRVLAVEQYGAGPYGSLHLADLGAEVIKIEDPRVGGDVGRYVPPSDGEDSLFFQTFNRNKRSLSLDLSTPAGREVFEDLVRLSDVVYSNLRGDVPDKLRLRYAHLQHLNPRIVCCCLSGFGMTGPRSAESGYDYLIQGLAGWMSLTGEPDGPPTKTGLSLVDWSGGLVAAMSVLAGLHAARRDGVGMDCDVSLFDTGISMLSYVATWWLNAGIAPRRTAHSAHPSIVPFQAFKTADAWIVVACPKDKFWERLVAVLGVERLEDERFSSLAGRQRHADELTAVLEPLFEERTAARWLEQLSAAGVPCAPVNDVESALTDEQAVARGLVVSTEHPGYGTVRAPASPVRVGDDGVPHRRAPERNEDFRHVVHDLLGYDDARVEGLRSAGAFGVSHPGDAEGTP